MGEQELRSWLEAKPILWLQAIAEDMPNQREAGKDSRPSGRSRWCRRNR